jgi:hypothetical protein
MKPGARNKETVLLYQTLINWCGVGTFSSDNKTWYPFFATDVTAEHNAKCEAWFAEFTQYHRTFSIEWSTEGLDHSQVRATVTSNVRLILSEGDRDASVSRITFPAFSPTLDTDAEFQRSFNAALDEHGGWYLFIRAHTLVCDLVIDRQGAVLRHEVRPASAFASLFNRSLH